MIDICTIVIAIVIFMLVIVLIKLLFGPGPTPRARPINKIRGGFDSNLVNCLFDRSQKASAPEKDFLINIFSLIESFDVTNDKFKKAGTNNLCSKIFLEDGMMKLADGANILVKPRNICGELNSFGIDIYSKLVTDKTIGDGVKKKRYHRQIRSKLASTKNSIKDCISHIPETTIQDPETVQLLKTVESNMDAVLQHNTNETNSDNISVIYYENENKIKECVEKTPSRKLDKFYDKEFEESLNRSDPAFVGLIERIKMIVGDNPDEIFFYSPDFKPYWSKKSEPLHWMFDNIVTEVDILILRSTGGYNDHGIVNSTVERNIRHRLKRDQNGHEYNTQYVTASIVSNILKTSNIKIIGIMELKKIQSKARYDEILLFNIVPLMTAYSQKILFTGGRPFHIFGLSFEPETFEWILYHYKIDFTHVPGRLPAPNYTWGNTVSIPAPARP